MNAILMLDRKWEHSFKHLVWFRFIESVAWWHANDGGELDDGRDGEQCSGEVARFPKSGGHGHQSLCGQCPALLLRSL